MKTPLTSTRMRKLGQNPLVVQQDRGLPDGIAIVGDTIGFLALNYQPGQRFTVLCLVLVTNLKNLDAWLYSGSSQKTENKAR